MKEHVVKVGFMLVDLDISLEHPNLDKAINKAKNNGALEVVPYSIDENMIKKAIIGDERHRYKNYRL
jgi:hypothetical protein